MRIAAVSFHWAHEDIGGAQVPAVAFKQWCDIFGIKCDLLGFTNEYIDTMHLRPDFVYLDLEERFLSVINGYDAVYFCTPGPMNDEGSGRFDFSGIKVPYVFHVHGEYDLSKMYNPFNVADLTNNVSCVGIATIDPRGAFWPFSKPMFPWHPCTLPAYLWKPTDPIIRNNGEGVIYAARIARSKNPYLFSWMAKRHPHLGPFHMYGIRNKMGRTVIEIDESGIRRFPSLTNVYDVKGTMERNAKHKFFFDVFGNDTLEIKMPRLNLSAVEALRSGCIPIVDMDVVPYNIHPISLDYRRISEYREPDPELYRATILSSQYSYAAVEGQVAKIVTALKGSKI
jgi:hypothetical protein